MLLSDSRRYCVAVQVGTHFFFGSSDACAKVGQSLATGVGLDNG